MDKQAIIESLEFLISLQRDSLEAIRAEMNTEASKKSKSASVHWEYLAGRRDEKLSNITTMETWLALYKK